MGNIYLIGMMGSGKSSTGKALAKLAKMDFVDLDEEIEGQTHQSINEIFKKKGEPYFRAEEKRILDEVCRKKNFVVATGGGIVLNPENIEKMRATGRVIYLKSGFETLWKRVKEKRDRPLLSVANPQGTLFRILQERTPLYEQSCEGEQVETDGLTPEAVGRNIFEKFLK